jgi:serine/threonine protein phosphatase PrpC
MKNSFSSISNSNILNRKKNKSKDMTNSKIDIIKNGQNRKQNTKNFNNKNNFKKTYTSPLIRYINLQENLINQEQKATISQKNRINSINKLTRSESFSILESHNKKNISNINEMNINDVKKDKDMDNKENNINQNNDNNTNKSIENISDYIKNNNNNKNSNKICKKIYKIESLCQVGYSGPGIVKYNQDNFFIYKNLNDETNVLFIGVCDGHGLFGHDVSKYLITHLPQNLNKALKKTNKYIHHKETLYKTMKEVFVNTNKDLCKNPLVDTQFSGSTCVTIILTKNKIISGNAGDSRAVMGRFKDGEWISIDLTHDQKPNNPGERERILSHGGRIEAYKDENGNDFGPKRVWIQSEDIPGLAMSRSFGDEVAASVGTISEPEIETFDITSDDKFIIIASDGIWEFISSQECVNIIKDYYIKKDLKGCLKYLLNESSKRWIKEEEVIDDITAVLIFFEE